MRQVAIVSVLALVLAAACTPAGEQPPSTTTATQTNTPSLTAAGEATQASRLEMNDNLAWAASVVELGALTHESNSGVKLFGLAGGDPAMNGLQTYLAFYESPAEGHQVFELGNFLDYRVLAEAPGRVDLEIQESTMDEASGTIGSRTRYVMITWTEGADGVPPMTITVTPAQQATSR